MTTKLKVAAGAETPPLIEFPCFFVIKIMGVADAQFSQQIVNLVKEHAPEFSDKAIEVRTSSAGNYISLSCNVWATSQNQLDAIYQSITAHPLVKFAL